MEGKKAPIRALVSTSFDHYNGGIRSSEEATKNLLFLLANGLADSLGLEFLEL